MLDARPEDPTWTHMEEEEEEEGRSEGGLHARNGLCGSCTCVRVAGVVGLLGSARRVGFVVVRYPLVVVFVGVRFDMGAQRKNALLSEIYVLARSETSRPKDSCRKWTQKL